MYLHEPPRPERFEPKTPRERRQAWKEGRLGFNRTQSYRRNTSKNVSNLRIGERRSHVSNHGRFVHGIKNAFAICKPIVGFS